MSCIIYILELENNKYYVGRTSNLQKRLSQHFSGSGGSRWTKLHKPIKLLKSRDNCNSFDEDKYTLMFIDKYGVDNVRGGSFSQITLPKETKKFIKKLIDNANDKCFICGGNHFANRCINKTETVDNDDVNLVGDFRNDDCECLTALFKKLSLIKINIF